MSLIFWHILGCNSSSQQILSERWPKLKAADAKEHLKKKYRINFIAAFKTIPNILSWNWISQVASMRLIWGLSPRTEEEWRRGAVKLPEEAEWDEFMNEKNEVNTITIERPRSTFEWECVFMRGSSSVVVLQNESWLKPGKQKVMRAVVFSPSCFAPSSGGLWFLKGFSVSLIPPSLCVQAKKYIRMKPEKPTGAKSCEKTTSFFPAFSREWKGKDDDDKTHLASAQSF